MAALDICMFYLRGSCRFGNRCRNSHDWVSFENAVTSSASMDADTGEECKPSSSSTINESQQDTTEEQQMVQPADEPEKNDDKSSNSELIEPSKKKAENLKEIERRTQLVLRHKSLLNEKKIDWNKIMEEAVTSDLQCNICMEIFIKPNVLSCSHTFCETCIFIWMQKVKRCPMCRQYIKSKSYCLTLDTFINKIVEFMPEETRDSRSTAIKDRSQIKVVDFVQQTRISESRMESILAAAGEDSSHPLLDLFMATSSDHDDEFDDDSDDDMAGNLIRDQTEVMRMNLQDIVLNSRGINPLSRYPSANNQRWPDYLLH